MDNIITNTDNKLKPALNLLYSQIQRFDDPITCVHNFYH